MAKSFNITKHEVWNAYLAVKANKGSAGIDKQTIADFDVNLKNNLYKIWNRMSSGSYFPPPVRRVEIPKSNGKVRPLGIPTISDRIAQMVVKNRLEPTVEPFFHRDSYGYRPGKSALDAIAQARQRCWRNNWVLDMDIKGFFDALDHKLVIKAVSRFTQCRWILLYIERWLKADVIMLNGDCVQRERGTPQGGVISPLIANIYLHLTFDNWMQRWFPCIEFERYADDIVVHCRSQQQLLFIEQKIRARFTQCKLELCEEKTKIVYCKDSNRKGDFPVQSFDFLGYTFRPRSARDRQGKFFVSFSPAVSRKALKSMRLKIKEHPIIKSCFSLTIEDLANAINPMIQGWINYYGRFRKSSLSAIYDYINGKLLKWVMRKCKRLKRRKTRAGNWLRALYANKPWLFAHWRVWRWVAE
ncbi:group II intron reverse transcriptase/maturase [Spartinivicinus marinus]|uniref:group II intron reverse transcriptase/maturase n=1 Tax=Spartinivicinus marinus TaxID=2994442 RepID=UPI001C5C8FFA|nr:group II intron reverse transcriptase/maturase [Spartinivicinus marinus]MCX4028832.1 group II intron reverse transcriptase/maturase [Spartinivicinus marinus]